MFSAAVKKLQRAWGKFPAFLALVALLASSLVALEIPGVAEAAGTSSCTTTNTYTSSNGYCTVTFTTTGADSFTVPANVDSLDMLIVGGGGGANRGICSYTYGAGGGGGGFLEVLGKAVTAGTVLTINVGAGGAGSNFNCYTWSQANSSPFNTAAGGTSSITGTSVNLVANGGTGARVQVNYASGPTSGSTSIDGVVTAGNAGGVNTWDSSGGCTQTSCVNGGGGGAGAAGSGMNAGAGKTSTITGNTYGGGGASTNGGTYGTASSGGATPAACDAVANRGGGGSDCASAGGWTRGGSGGSGIVVIRYLVKPTLASQPADTTVTTSPTRTATFSVGAVTTAASLTSPTVTYQWQESPDNGTTWANVSTGTGGTTNSYTTPTLSTTAKNGTKYRVKVTQTSGSVTNFTYSNAATLSVTAASQTISFTNAAPTDKKVGDTYSIAATATSGLAVTFSIASGSTSNCSVSGSTITFLAAGSCVVAADQAGSAGTYLAAPQVTQTISTSKANQTIAFTSSAPTTAVYGSGSYTPTATGGVSTSAVTFAIDATASAVCSISSGVVTYTGAGTCVINANQAGDSNYNAASQVQQSFTVAKASQSISFTSTAPTTAAVGGTSYTPTATATSGTSVTFTIDLASLGICVLNAGVVTFTGVGNCIVNANQAGNTNYNAAAQVQQTFAVAKGSQTITFTSTAPSSAVVSGSTYTPTATSTSGGSVTFTIDAGSAGICSISAGVVSFQSVGSCKVLANQAGGTNWNAAAQNSQTFTVGKGTPTLTFTSSATSPKVTTTYTPVASSSSSGAVTYTIDATSSAICSISNGTVTFNGAGTCKVNANQATDSNWSASSQVQQSITVGKGDQTISWTSTAPTNAVVSGSTYTPTATSTSGATVTFSSTSIGICSVSNGVVSFTGVGTCAIKADQSGDTNWNAATQVSQSITVGKGDQAISFSSNAPTTAVFGTGSYTPTATGGASTSSVTFAIDATASAVCSISAGVVTYTGAGTCVINANQAGDTNYKAATQVQQSFSVAKASQTITFSSTTPATPVVDVGSYTPTATGGGSGNTVTFTIDIASLGICVINNGVVTYTGAGSCIVNANQSGSANYNAATQVQQTFTIGKGSQTVAFTSAAPTDAKPNGTYTVTASKGNSSSSVALSVAPASSAVCSVSGLVVTFLAVGNCLLNLDQAGDSNYNAAAQVQQLISVTADGRCPFGVSQGGTYCIYRFNSNGTFTVPSFISSIDILAVGGGGAGGGGGGGNAAPGGGGGGQVVESLGRTVSPGSTLTVTIGAGGVGAGAVADGTAGGDGGSSTVSGTGISTVTALGGGHGAAWRYISPSPGVSIPAGGSGLATGGGGHGQISTRLVAPGVGSVSSGGTGQSDGASSTRQLGGGGGGAGGNGSNASGTVAGAGGPGLASVILGTTLGGGGGGAVRGASGGTVGSATAGGGAGGAGAAGTAGTANTGGGGGGSAGSNNGANGGSGVVVIRFAMTTNVLSFSSSAPTDWVHGTSSTYTPVATGGISGATITYAIDSGSASVCEIANGSVRELGAGTCTVKASQVGSGYTADTLATQSFTIAKAGQTLSYTSTAPSNATVGGSTYTVTATGGSSTSAVTFTIDSTASSVCSISGAVVSFLTVGTCKVNANQAGDANYNAASQIQQSITVAKGEQTITFTSPAPSSALVAGSSYSPTATSTSGGIVAFTIDSGSTSVCSISAGAVSFQSAGSCKVLANQTGNTNWNAAAQVSQTFTVGKGTTILAFTSSASSPKVNTSYTPVASSSSTGTVTYTIDASTNSTCSISSGVVTFNAVGTCKVNANQVTDGNWSAPAQVQQSITVAKGDQSITFTSTAPTSAVVSGSTYTPTATATSGDSVTFTIDASSASVCSITTGSITFQTPGSCKVLANQAGNSNWNTATQVSQTFTVGKGTPTLSFTSSASSPKVGTTYTPVASSSSSGAVSYAVDSSTSSICSISSGVVSFLTVGTCKVNASQLTDNNWLSVSQVQQSITIAKGDQTITFTSTVPSSAVVAGASYTPTATATSGASVTFTIDSGSSAVCSISAGAVSFQTAGICKVLADQAGNSNWNAAAQVSQTITVGKGTTTLAFTSSASSPKVNSTYTPVASSSSTGAVTYTIDATSSGICSISSGQVSFNAVGTCKVNANQATDSNWNAPAQTQQSITTLRGDQAITFTSTAPTGAVVSGASYTPTATATSGGSVAFTIDNASSAVCSISSGVVSFNTVGTCKVLADQAGNSNWNAAAQVSQIFTVGKGTPTLTFTSSASSPKVGTTYTPVASSSSTGAVSFTIDSTSSAVCSISSGVVSFNTVGTCTVNASQLTDSNWIAVSQVQQSITTLKGEQAISITSTAPNNAVVDGATYAVTATGGASTSPLEISIDGSASTICSARNGVVSFLTAGDCVVKVTQAGDDNYNAASDVTQTITVGKGSQSVAFVSNAPTGVRVGDAGYFPTASGGASSSSIVITVRPSSTAICAINNGEVSFTAVGSCVLEVNQAGDANYTAAAAQTQTITVAKGLQTINKTSVDPTNAVVDGTGYTPTFAATPSGNSVVVSISSSSSAICTVANGVITFVGAGDCDYNLNLSGNSNYEAAAQVSATISVAKGSQSISFTSTAPSNAVVGGTTYNPAATGGASNNAVTFRIDFNTASVCAITSGVVRFVGVGTCTVLANQSGNSNYNAASAALQTFTVGKGAQAIAFTSSAPSNAVVAGTTYTPVATGGATGNAVTFSIASSSVSVCSLNFGKISFQNVGTCEIEANQLGNSNYNAAPLATQSFTVGKGAQVLAFTSSAPSAKVSGATYAPVVSGGASGNSVDLSIAPSSTSICSVNNGVVSFQAVGSCVVQANQASSANYEAAAQVTQTITVAKGTQVLNFTSTPPSLRPVQGTTYTPTVTYGNSGQPVVFTIGAAASSICTISNGVISFLAVGDCILNADQAGNSNYTTAARIIQIFDITKGEQIVNITSTAPSGAVVDGATYTPTGTGGAGTKPVVFTATAESTGICTVLVGIVYFQGAGDCVIALNQAGDTNYNAATAKLQTITVGKGSQSITFTSTNTTATVDGAAYTPITHGGSSINPVRISVASSSALICEVNSGAVIFHAVGDCVIEANQAADNNYNAAPTVTQTISVAKGEQAELTAQASLASLTLGANTPTAILNTVGGSGTGSVTWTVAQSSSAICSVNGDTVSGLASGYCQLTATKDGDDNYLVKTASLTLVVSTGGQTPVQTSVNNATPTFSEGLILTLSLAGGDGAGAVWYESLTTHVCNTNGSAELHIYHAGDCTVIGHKDGDDNYQAVEDSLTFSIAKAAQSGISIHLAHDLTFSPVGAVSQELSLVDVLSGGTQSLSVTAGSCTLENGSLVATEAGNCEVTASILGDDKYLDGTFTHTFTVGKAAQSALTVTRSTNAPVAVAWNGTKVTSFDITGGSGPTSLTATSSTPLNCSVELSGSVVTVTGIAQGTCNASVTNASSSNYLEASTLFSVEVLDLAPAPTNVSAANAVKAQDGSLSSRITWTAPSAAANKATVTGYRVQYRIGTGAWTDVINGNVDAAANSLNVTVQPWTKYNFRVASTSALDGDTVNWAYFDLAGDSVPDQIIVGGGQVVLSTTKAATTSGETVFVTGAGFDPTYTTRVELNTASPVFAAGIRPAAALQQTIVVPATVISATKLSFVLPKITLPKGVTTLTSSIKVLSTDGVRSDPIPLEYIPKKLAQVLTGTLPAASTPITVGTNLTSDGAFTSSVVSNPPVITATPANVCTAAFNLLGKLVITPVSPGKCSISVVVPGTPAYIATAAKTAVYSIKAYRTPGFSVTASDVDNNGIVGSAKTFTQVSTLGQSSANLNVTLGDDPVDIPVGLSSRQGTISFTVLPADEAAGRCTADGGDATNGLFGSISILDVGQCKVTITQAADGEWFAGESIIIIVNTTARTTPAGPDNGSATLVPANELADILDSTDPDDPTTPPVQLTIDPTVAATYMFGGEDGIDYDPLTGRINIRSRTALVGVWTAKFTSPNASLKWFKVPGKVVKGVQQFGAPTNTCTTSLTVKKDPKLKKKVTRIVGNGCYLTDAGKTAMTAIGIQKIKVKYKRTRQYAKTGLDFQGTPKAKKRILKKMNRTIVMKIGRRA